MRLDLCKEIWLDIFAERNSPFYFTVPASPAVEWKRKKDDIDSELSFVKRIGEMAAMAS